MQIESVALNKIIPYIRNPRKNENAIEKVASSIKEFGFRQPIVVDSENVIIAGHTRFEAAKRLGLDVVPIHVADGLTEQQAKAYRIADNRVGQEAEWDYDLLKLELEELDNPELTGFDEDELNGILAEVGEGMTGEEGLTDPDEVPEVPVEPVTVSGDLWELGDHRLLCGDATKAEDVERLMGGEKADMVFTDPPYGVDYSGGIQFTSKGVKKNQRQRLIDDQKETDIYTQVIPIIAKYTEGAIYIWFAGTKAQSVYEAINKVGDIHALLIWRKRGGFSSLNANYKENKEPFLYWKPKGGKLNFIGKTTETTVWDIDKDFKNKYHPTQKPVELGVKAISNHDAKSVLDLFLGSGSTLIACQKTNRKCYGMEIDQHYCDVIITRWSDFTGKDDLLLNGKPFKWSERKIKKAA